MVSEVITEAGQYFTFTLGEEEFALAIDRVREVLDYTTITKVPRMPQFLRGVINLRGNVVPVVDLRQKLGMSAIEKTVDTCIVIIDILIEGELTQMGALTDSVKEVIDLDPGEIAPPPRMGTQLDNKFIKGMGKQDERFLIILDIDKVFSAGELEVVTAAGGSDERDSEDMSVGHVPEAPVPETENQVVLEM